MGENVEGLSVREASIAAVEAIAAIADETGLPKLLSSQGVTEDKIPTLAKDAFAAGSTANNPRVPTVAIHINTHGRSGRDFLIKERKKQYEIRIQKRRRGKGNLP